MYQPIDHGHVCYQCVPSTVAGGERVKRCTAFCAVCGHRGEGRLMRWDDCGPLKRGVNFVLEPAAQSNTPSTAPSPAKDTP